MGDLTQERLKELFDYNFLTGVLLWRVKPHIKANSIFPGKKAGCSTGYKYWAVVIDKKKYSYHRVVWLYVTGEWPQKDIDHIDGDRSNNKWGNLRLASRSENMMNLKSHHKDSQTGYLGIEKKRDKYMARICVNGKRIGLGTYIDPKEAHNAYLEAKRKYHQGFNTL